MASNPFSLFKVTEWAACAFALSSILPSRNMTLAKSQYSGKQNTHTYTRSQSAAPCLWLENIVERDRCCVWCEGCQDARMPVCQWIIGKITTMEYLYASNAREAANCVCTVQSALIIHLFLCTCALASFFSAAIHFRLLPSQQWVQRTLVALQSALYTCIAFPLKLRTFKMQFRQLSDSKVHQRDSNRIQIARGSPNLFFHFFHHLFVTDGHEEDENENKWSEWRTNCYRLRAVVSESKISTGGGNDERH